MIRDIIINLACNFLVSFIFYKKVKEIISPDFSSKALFNLLAKGFPVVGSVQETGFEQLRENNMCSKIAQELLPNTFKFLEEAKQKFNNKFGYGKTPDFADLVTKSSYNWKKYGFDENRKKEYNNFSEKFHKDVQKYLYKDLIVKEK